MVDHRRLARVGLLVHSVMQARVLCFRVLNLAACVVLAAFNAALAIWPMVAMNVALSGINRWHIRGLVGSRHDEESYDVIEVVQAYSRTDLESAFSLVLD